VLRACRRVLKPGGRLAFFTIFVPDDVSGRDYRRALDSGPTFVSSRRRDHQEMLRAAGFKAVREVDLTRQFIATSRAWYRLRNRYPADLIAVEGRASFEERQYDYERQISAAQDGLLRRSLFICY
jgi:hypothetical protein